MQVRPLIAAVLAATCVALTALLVTLVPSRRRRGAPRARSPPPRDDDTIHFTGLPAATSARSPPSAVPDVTINVEDDSGEVVGTGTSDETGVFDIALPGDLDRQPGQDVHGQDRHGHAPRGHRAPRTRSRSR